MASVCVIDESVMKGSGSSGSRASTRHAKIARTALHAMYGR